MNVKTFVLGVGAQKSGTTWLYEYMKLFENVDMGFMKEYSIFSNDLKNKKVNARRFLTSSKHRKRYYMMKSDEYYFDYFCGLLATEKIEITGDISPSYATLKSDVFCRIYEGFQRRGVECKVVFLMRDPVERCWSARRMIKRSHSLEESDEDLLLKYFRSKSAERRTRYDTTIKEIEKAFPERNVYYGIYEEMFQNENIEKLSEFIGIQKKYQFKANKFNTTEKRSDISLETKKKVADQFYEVYEFCARRFPVTRDIWAGYPLSCRETAPDPTGL